MKHNVILLGLIGLLLAGSISLSPVQAQEVHPSLAADLQAALDLVRSVKNVTGVSAAVIAPGQGTWLGASGVSYAGPDGEMRTDMLLSAGSITKMFVATVILQLAQEGVLTLDDQLQTWLPDLPNYLSDPASADMTITIRQLLNHTSLLYDYAEDPELQGLILANPYKIWTPEELVSYIRPFESPTPWFYSNTNYLLLGMIIKQATGNSVSTELQQRIFAPLNLTETYLEIEQSLPAGRELAHGWYDVTGDGIPDDFSIFPRNSLYSMAWTAGGIVSTPENTARFLQALLTGQLLSPVYLNDMLNAIPISSELGYGLGIFKVAFTSEISLWGHVGEIPGYTSVVLYLPGANIVTAVFTNDNEVDGILDFVQALLQVVLAFEGPQTEALQAFLDSLAVDGTNDVRAATDFLSDLMDSTWKITVPTGSVSTFMFTTVESQDGYTFGIYNNGQYVDLFTSNMTPGAQTLLEILTDGSVFVNHSDTGIDFADPTFGFFLDTGSNRFYSDTALNSDGVDHMLAYQGVGEVLDRSSITYEPGVSPWGPDEFLLAWEDMLSGPIKDYMDYVVMIKAIVPTVPEPATLLLLSTGVLGLAVYTRKRRSKARFSRKS
ncbi:hypothetical protein Despr_1056 [Candidatus Vecturithrix granuli]|uniref:Beta-lactamase-related domain-containing protein n=1 Tax=Vecturithrix granuli TaxID=1499967 RepID=A0A081BVD9_VECG1|nr:hypothetical protein Despr_1056 [Candidatus Vecturithrix granuli]